MRLSRHASIGMSARSSRTNRKILLAGMVGLCASSAYGVNLSWDPALSSGASLGGSGNWDLSTANWFDGASDIAWTDTTGATDVAVFTGNTGTITLNANVGALGLVFSNPGYTITGANTLTLGVNGIDANLVRLGSANVESAVALAGSQAWNIGLGGTLAFSGSISESAASTITKNGVGVLVLSGNNTYSGGVTLAAGQLNLAHAGALGTGSLVVSAGATLDNSSGGALTNSNNNTLQLNANLTFLGSNNLNFGTGPVNFGADRSITVKGSNLTLGALNGSGFALSKFGAGTMTIDNASNAYSHTTLGGGALALGTTGVLGTGTIAIAGAELRIDGNSSGARAVTSGTLFNVTGRNVVTLVADPSQPVSYTASDLGLRNTGATPLFRGTNLGATPGNGVATIKFTTAPTATATIGASTFQTNSFVAQGSGALNSTQAAVLRGALADTTATGTGMGFATYDPTNGVRLLNSSEQLPVASGAAYTASATGDNVLISNASMSITGKQTNTLQINNTSAGAITITNGGTGLNATNGLLFTGNQPITLTGGTASVSFGSNTGDMVILSTNTAGVTIGSALNVTASSGERGYVFGGPGAITLNAAATGPGGNGGYQINGPGTVTLNGAMTTSSKGMVVNGGTLKLGPSFTMSSSRPFAVAQGATLDMNGTSVSNVERLDDINGVGGTITNTSLSAATLTLTQGSNVTGNRNYTGVITGNINLRRNAGATVTGRQQLSAQNSYTGSTTIDSGTIALGISDALPTGTSLVLNSGGATASILEMNGFNQTVASLSGTGGSIVNASGTRSTLTIAGAANTTYAGSINDGVGIVALTRAGSGETALNGTNNYTGATRVNSGTLRINGSLGNSTVTVASGATLGGAGSIAGPVTVQSGGILSPGASVGTLTLASLNISSGAQTLNFEIGASPGVSDVINVTGSDALLIGSTPASKTINFASSGGGAVQSGTYTLIDYTGTPFSDISQFTVGTLPLRVSVVGGALINNSGNTSIDVNLLADAPKWKGNNGNVWDINSTQNWELITAATPTTYLQPGAVGDDVTFDDSAVNGNVDLANSTFTPAGILVNNSSLNYTFGGAGTLSGGTGLTKQGSGTLTLSNTGGNTYTGATNVNGGVLVLNTTMSNTGATNIASGATVQIGTGGTTGSIGSGSISNSGTLAVMHSGNVTLAGVMTGSGSLTQSGGGTVSLNGSLSGYNGNIAVSGSTLKMGHASGIGSANLNLSNATLTQSTNATIYNGGTASASFSKINFVGSNVIDPAGSLMNLSAELVGDSTASITRVGGGTLAFGASAGVSTFLSNGSFAGTLTNTTGTMLFASRNSGSAAAKFIFTGGNIVIGNAGGTVNMGYLEGSAPITANSGTARLRVGDASNATTTLSSTYSGNITGTTLSMAKFGTGSFTVTGQNSFAGPDGVTFLSVGVQGWNTVVGSGTLVGGSTTNGTTSGPFGGSTARVLLGNRDSLSDAALMVTGNNTIANAITASGGGGAASTGYTLRLGGVSDNAATFSGNITLQNDLTVTQTATTGGNALNITGNIDGVQAGRGPESEYDTYPGTNNDGTQTLTFAGPGRINVPGAVGNGTGVVSVTSTGGTITLSGGNTYTGQTTANGGVLILQNGANDTVETGLLGGITNGGAIVLDYNDDGNTGAWGSEIVTDLEGNANTGFLVGRIRTTAALDATKAIGWLDDTTAKTFSTRYTYKGDINLSGVVESTDFAMLAAGYGKFEPTVATVIWKDGDVNYDGKVNTIDFNYLAGNFGLAAFGGAELGATPGAALGAVVPEPSSVALLAMGATALVARRRRGH